MNSETKLQGFKERLSLLIGAEQPFAWASRIGIPGATFNRMWNDGTAPKADHLATISKATGCSIDWLLTGEGEMRRDRDVYRAGGPDVAIVVEPATPFAQDAESEELCRLLKRYGNRALVEDVKARLLKIKAVVEG